MIERTSSGPLCLAAKSDRIKKDKTLLPRCWGTISKNLESDSKTYGQSMDFKSIPEIRCKMKPALRDQHEGSRLAYECGTPGKSRAKIKALKWIGNLAWYQLGKERYPGLLPRTNDALMVSEIKLSTYILRDLSLFSIFGSLLRRDSPMSSNFNPYEFFASSILCGILWPVLGLYGKSYVPRWPRDLIQIKEYHPPFSAGLMYIFRAQIRKLCLSSSPTCLQT